MLSQKVTNILKTKKKANLSNANLYYQLLVSMKMNPKQMTAKELLQKMHAGKVPSFDSVSRAARKAKTGN